MTTKDILFAWCVKQLGRPYIWGGNGWGVDRGYDCSGLAQEFYSLLGIDPPGDQTAQGYYNYWWPQLDRRCYHIAKAKVCFGDMLFFGMDKNHISHIAIAMGRHILLEAGGGGSNCHTAEDARKIGAEVRFHPIHLRKDFICAIRPYHFSEMIINQ